MLRAPHRRSAYSLAELMAVLAATAVVAVIIVPRIAARRTDADKAACQANIGQIEVQSEIWRHNLGVWPTANLSDVGGSVHYFPSGLPVCPVTGAAYTINTSGRVIGHSH